MQKMKQKIKWILTAIFLFSGVFSGILWLKKLQLDYNSEGRYFDQETGLVYTDNGLTVFGTFTIVFLLIGSIFLFVTLTKKK